MDIGTIFVGIVLLVVAWALWTYLPHPLGVIAGLIVGLVGLYFLLIGLLAGIDHNERVGLMLPGVLAMSRMRRAVL